MRAYMLRQSRGGDDEGGASQSREQQRTPTNQKIWRPMRIIDGEQEDSLMPLTEEAGGPN